MTIINNAYTVLADGKKFFYFDAVDRGRKAMVGANGKPIVFLSRFPPGTPSSERINTKLKKGKGYGAPFLIFAKKVSAAKPAYISLRARDLIKNNFLHDVSLDLQKFVKSLGNKFASQFGETAESLPNLEYAGFARGKTNKTTKRSREAERKRKALRNEEGFQERVEAERKAKQKLRAQEKARKSKDKLTTPKPTLRPTLVKKDGTRVRQDDEVTIKPVKKGINPGLVTAAQAQQAELSLERPPLEHKTYEIVNKIPVYFSDFQEPDVDKIREEITDEEVNAYIEELLPTLHASGDTFIETVDSTIKKNVIDIIINDKIRTYKAQRREITERFKADSRKMQKAFGTPVYYGKAKQGGFIVESAFEKFDNFDQMQKEQYIKDQAKLKEVYNDAKRNIWLQMLKLENPDAFMHIISRAVAKQVKHYQKVTPSRKGFKFLAFSNTYLEPNAPSKGSHPDVLKNSYKLVTGKQMTDRLRRYGTKK